MLPHAHPETLGIPTGDLQEIGRVHVEKLARGGMRMPERRPGLWWKAVKGVL